MAPINFCCLDWVIFLYIDGDWNKCLPYSIYNINGMTPNQKKLLDKINCLGRLLNEEEIIDFYVENNSKGTCHSIDTINGIKTIEEKLWQIKPKAELCYTYALGRLVLAGHFTIK